MREIFKKRREMSYIKSISNSFAITFFLKTTEAKNTRAMVVVQGNLYKIILEISYISGLTD